MLLAQHFGRGRPCSSSRRPTTGRSRSCARTAIAVVSVGIGRRRPRPGGARAAPWPRTPSRRSSTRSRPSRTRADARSRPSGGGEIVEIARSHGALLLEDDPYGLIRFEGETPPSIFELAPRAELYTSSFSKTIAPGPSRRLVHRARELSRAADRARELDLHHPGAARARRRSSSSSAAAASSRTSSGSTACCEARRDAMLAALEKHFAGARWSRPEGGYFIWLELPEGTNAERGARPGRGRHGGARHRLRRCPEHAPARLQLRLARRDRRWRRAARRCCRLTRRGTRLRHLAALGARGGGRRLP